jgi:transcription antitermination factor NusG
LDASGLKSIADYAPQWFAVFTSPRHEKRVAQHLAAREVDFFLPLYHPTHEWKHRGKMQLDLPLFPNYIFARIDRRERMRVLPVPGVLSIVGTKQELSGVPETYIDALRKGLGQYKVEPHPYLTAGERIRIVKGALAGMEGILVGRKNEFRVVIALELIRQSVVLDIDIADLEGCKTEVHAT